MVENRVICLKKKEKGKKTANLGSNLIRFKNNFKQLVVPFKIYPDFELVLKGFKNNDKNIALRTLKNIFLAVLLKKLCVLMINLASQFLFTEEEMQ